MRFSAELVDELRIQVRIGWPVAASMFLNRMLPVSSILFLGHSVSSRKFAGAMLAMTLSNVSGMSVLVGLAGATSTLCESRPSRLNSATTCERCSERSVACRSGA